MANKLIMEKGGNMIDYEKLVYELSMAIFGGMLGGLLVGLVLYRYWNE